MRAEAAARLLNWYLGTAQSAADMVSPHRYQVAPAPVTDGLPVVRFAGVDEALAWYDDERTNLAVAARQAAAAGLHDIAWRLPPTLFPVFNRRSSWAECVTMHRVALESVRKVGDRLGEAWVLNQLGFALAKLREPEAFGYLEQALAIRQEFGDTLGEAQTALALGEWYLNVQGPGEDALRYMRRGADLLEPIGAISLRSVALNNLGEVHFGLGDLEAAAECYIQARDICRKTGGYVEGHVLHNLGLVFLCQRRLDEATASFAEALRKHRAAGLLVGEAWTLKDLARAQAETGDMAGACASLAAASKIFEEIGDKAGVAETTSLLVSLSTSWPCLQVRGKGRWGTFAAARALFAG